MILAFMQVPLYFCALMLIQSPVFEVSVHCWIVIVACTTAGNHEGILGAVGVQLDMRRTAGFERTGSQQRHHR